MQNEQKVLIYREEWRKRYAKLKKPAKKSQLIVRSFKA